MFPLSFPQAGAACTCGCGVRWLPVSGSTSAPVVRVVTTNTSTPRKFP